MMSTRITAGYGGKRINVTALSLIALALLIVSYGMFFCLHDSLLLQLMQEDGIIETSGAVCFLAASVVAFVLFFKVDNGNDFYFLRTQRNVFFVVLGFLFLFAFGEEISWGQRIFGFATPQALQGVNTQDEVNIHNLSMFRIISMNRLFSFFWFGYCVLLPLANRVSKRIRRELVRINLPVLSGHIGLLFVANYAIARIVYSQKTFGMHNAVIEMKEFNFGMLFLVVVISFVYVYLNGIESKKLR